MSMKRKDLKRELERLYRTFDHGYLSSDPLEFVHRYHVDTDREIAGLVSSSLAYGRVAGIRSTLEKVFSVTGQDLFVFTRGFDPKKGPRAFSGITHRFNTPVDIACLFYFARQMIEDSGSIGAFFMRGFEPGDKNVKRALSVFSQKTLSLDTGGLYGRGSLPREAGVRYFFPDPTRGSACKRLNLYLRWMVRRGDSLDFGIWKEVPPSKLVIPLDTHIARISRNIGLTTRGTPDWKMAEEITDELRRLDPVDPVKYDFALSRLGILEKCPRRTDSEKCLACSIKGLCVL
jgi:uncharacterized protein (TIGR02757 family)